MCLRIEQVDKKEKEKAALSVSLDTRKFEIDLYWKRASYFWGFIAATFTGYFIVLSSKNVQYKNIVLFFLNCLGIFSTWIWFLVLKGSKYWQENWERHVGDKEKYIHGFVFNRIIKVYKSPIIGLKALPYSVSKLNLILSLFILSIWLMLFIYPSNADIIQMVSKKLGIIPTLKNYKILIIKGSGTFLLVFFGIVSCRYGKSSFYNKVVEDENEENNEKEKKNRYYQFG